MENFHKKKYIVHETNYLKTDEQLKKFKINGLTYESHSPINWLDVKIVVDAKVVEKYLNNRKSNGEIVTTAGNNAQTICRDKNVVPQANETFSSAFSKINDVMVKLEVSEETQYDYSAKKTMFEFVNVPIKLEENEIKSEKFQESMYSNLLRQNNKNHAPFTEQIVFKNEENISDFCHEELEIGSEFKHEELIPNYENSKLINQENNVAREKLSTQRIRRSKKKKKQSRIRVHNNSIESPFKTLSKTNIHNPLDNFQTRTIIQKYYCGHCDFKSLWKANLPYHIRNKHSWLFHQKIDAIHVKCFKCGTILVPNDEIMERHRELCSFSVCYPCMFCPRKFIDRQNLRNHLSVHIEEPDEMIIENIVKELAAVRNIMNARFKEKIKSNIEANEIIKDSGYYLNGIHSILKPICFKCNNLLQQDEICVKCKTLLTFQCLRCDQYFMKYFIAWEHVTRICKNRIITLPANESSDYGNNTTYICYAKQSNHPMNLKAYFLDHSYARQLPLDAVIITKLKRWQ